MRHGGTFVLGRNRLETFLRQHHARVQAQNARRVMPVPYAHYPPVAPRPGQVMPMDVDIYDDHDEL